MESINYQVYELNGVSMPLDLDDLGVERRVDAANANMQERAAKIEADQTPGALALKFVNILRDCVNEIFGREDAADLIFGDENRLTGYNARFNAMAYHIGMMRGAALNAATRALVATNAARVLNTADASPDAAQNAEEITEIKYIGKPLAKKKKKGILVDLEGSPYHPYGSDANDK